MEEFGQEIAWIGKQLGKYKVLKLVGCGGMGAVYQAVNVVLDKIVCLKILFPALVRQGQKIVARFLREARAIARLEHPYIVRIYDIDEEGGTYFIVMEYVDGKSLAQLFEEREAFSVRETLHIGIETAEALAVAHRNNIIHRDVKPANIMIRDEHVKLTDFGLAHMSDDGQGITSGEILGTPYYLAPEYILGRTVDARMDLYALGVTLYQMLSGVPPYTGRNPLQILDMHISRPVPSIRDIRGDVPLEFDAIISKLMVKDPQSRFATADEVALALRDCHNSLQEVQRAPTAEFTRESLRDIRVQHAQDVTDSAGKIRVLVVEDSHAMAHAIERVLREEKDICPVGIAHNGREALDQIAQLDPQVVTLDFNMPEMDGITAVKHIISRHPRPVIMLSALTYDGAWTTFECLSCGAVDFMWKPSRSQLREFRREFAEKIRNAARIRLTIPGKLMFAKSLETAGHLKRMTTAPASSLVIMGAGEGGYQALLKIIPHLPRHFPCAVVVVQQMPEEMGTAFTGYLNYYSRLLVQQIEDRETLREGVCYMVSHNTSLKLEKVMGELHLRKLPAAKDGGQGNAFGDLIAAAADQCAAETTVLALSGEDSSAVAALGNLKERGGMVMVQDPETCLRPEIVDLAVEKGLADKVVLDIDMAAVLWHLMKSRPRPAAAGVETALDETARKTARIGKGHPSRLETRVMEKVSPDVGQANLASILLVEDDRINQKLMRRYLEQEGYLVTAADDGTAALDILAGRNFDLILADINMPGLDGFKMLEIKRQRGIATPLIFVTARTEAQDEIEALSLGAQDYIRKPVHKEILLIRVQNCLKNCRNCPKTHRP